MSRARNRSYAHEMERMTGSGDLKRRAMVQNYLIRQPSILEEEEMGSVVPLKQVTTSLTTPEQIVEWLKLFVA